MAIVLDSTDKANRTTSIVSAASDYSCVFWAKVTAFPAGADYIALYTIINAGYTAWAGFFAYSDSTFALDLNNGGAGNSQATIPETSGVWHAFGYTRSGTTQSFYFDGVLVSGAGFTLDMSAVTFTEMIVGYDGFSVNGFQVQGFREFNSALTLTQIIAEWNSSTPVLTSYSSIPFATTANDISGNGRNMTNTGGTFQAGPTQVPLTNTTSGTAYEITSPDLPFELAQVVVDGTGTTQSVWYKYTESASSTRVMDFRFYGVIGGGVSDYRPLTELYTPGLVFIGQTTRNCNSQLPLSLSDALLFRALRNGAAIAPAVLYANVIGASQATEFPAGTIFIRSASISADEINAGYTGLPGGYIDITGGGEIIGFVPQFQTGESGDILPATGRTLFADEFSSDLPFSGTSYGVGLYNPDFTLRTSFLFDAGGSGRPLIRTHNESNQFYILSKGIGLTPGTFRSVDADGNLGTLHSFTGGAGCTAFCVSADQTILYKSGVSGSANSNIKRWDIVNDVYLSDLVATVANYRVSDMLALSDGSILVLYFKSTVVRDAYVKHYDSTGATLNTYTFSLSATITGIDPRLGYAAEGTSFHILQHLTTGFGDIRKVRIADGAELYASLTPDAINTNIEQVNPPMTVTSDSCPIIELRVSEGDGGGGFTYTVVEYPIRRLRRAPHLNNENKRLFYPGIELDFQRGVGILSNPGVIPDIMFRISRDGGRTWSSYMKMSAGEMGQYRARAVLKRLGDARDAVFEVTVSDPNNFVLTNAWLTPDPTLGNF